MKRFRVLEIAIATDSDRVAKEVQTRFHISTGFHIASHIAEHAELRHRIVGEDRTVLLGELSAHIHQILRGAVRHIAGQRIKSFGECG